VRAGLETGRRVDLEVLRGMSRTARPERPCASAVGTGTMPWHGPLPSWLCGASGWPDMSLALTVGEKPCKPLPDESYGAEDGVGSRTSPNSP
jgi:hypothetical protein